MMTGEEKEKETAYSSQIEQFLANVDQNPYINVIVFSLNSPKHNKED